MLLEYIHFIASPRRGKPPSHQDEEGGRRSGYLLRRQKRGTEALERTKGSRERVVDEDSVERLNRSTGQERGPNQQYLAMFSAL